TDGAWTKRSDRAPSSLPVVPRDVHGYPGNWEGIRHATPFRIRPRRGRALPILALETGNYIAGFSVFVPAGILRCFFACANICSTWAFFGLFGSAFRKACQAAIAAFGSALPFHSK